MRELVEEEEAILKYKGTGNGERGTGLPDDMLVQAKKDGFSDKYLSLNFNTDRKEEDGHQEVVYDCHDRHWMAVMTEEIEIAY